MQFQLDLICADRRSVERRRVFAVEELDALVVQVRVAAGVARIAPGIAVGVDGLLPAILALQRRIRGVI